jgi:hypothetical protein
MLDNRKVKKDRMLGRRPAEKSCLSQGQLAEAAGVLCDLMAVPADYVHQILANIYEVGTFCRLRMKKLCLISSLRVSILLMRETPRERKNRARICAGQIVFRWTESAAASHYQVRHPCAHSPESPLELAVDSKEIRILEGYRVSKQMFLENLQNVRTWVCGLLSESSAKREAQQMGVLT